MDDDEESVKLGFGNTHPAGVTEGTTNETVVSITDDDITAQSQVSVQVQRGLRRRPLSDGIEKAPSCRPRLRHRQKGARQVMNLRV